MTRPLSNDLCERVVGAVLAGGEAQHGPAEIHHAAAPYLGDNPLSTNRGPAGILMHAHPALSRKTAALTPAASPGSGRMDNLLKVHTWRAEIAKPYAGRTVIVVSPMLIGPRDLSRMR
jgi:hypothetical protein